MQIVLIALLAAATVPDLMSEAERHIQAERFAQAEPLLEQVLRLDSKHVEAHYRLGYIHYRQRKLVSARRHLGATVQLAPPALGARYFLGRIALLENNPQQAVTWLEPILAAKERVFDTPSQLAAAYAGTGQLRKAIPMLKMAIAATPWDGALYFRLGQLLQQTGQRELARDAFESSRKLKNADREDVETLMQTAAAVNAAKQEEAERLGAKIMQRAAVDPNALVALGVVYGEAGMARQALGAFERAAGMDASFFQAQYNFGLALLKAGESLRAIEPLRRAGSLLPQSFEANLSLGLAYVLNGDYQAAIPPLERARAAEPSHTRAASLLATSYLRKAQATKAVLLFREVRAKMPDDPTAYLLLVEALNAVEDQEAALRAAEEAQKRFPGLAPAHMAVGQQLARLGRYQEARPAFQETLRLAPDNAEASLGLADTLQKNGEHNEAAGHYEKAMAAKTTSLAARLGLARSLSALRRWDKARAVLEEGLPLHPDDAALRLELSRALLRLGLADLAAEQSREVERLRARPRQ